MIKLTVGFILGIITTARFFMTPHGESVYEDLKDTELHSSVYYDISP